MRSTTRRRANFIAGNFAHLHQGLCSSSTPHCLACSATLNSLHSILLHYDREHPLVTLCMQSDKHAISRQAKDTTQTGYYAHCTGIVHKLNDRATSQGHNADRIHVLCLACGDMTWLRFTALESYTNQTKCTASNACTRAESTFLHSSSAWSH